MVVLVVVIRLVRRREEVLISHTVSLQVRRFSDLTLTALNHRPAASREQSRAL